MATLDSLRRAAHRRAWYNQQGDPPTYNPFGRSRTRTLPIGDEENGVAPLNPAGGDQDHVRGIPNHPSDPGTSAGLTEKGKGLEGAVVSPNNEDPAVMRGHHGIRSRFFRKATSTDSQVETERKKMPAKKFTLWSQIKGTLFNSYINILLVAVPVGIAVNFTNVNPVAIFVINFIAIIPLAAMLSYATEEIALRVGETLGGLLNASFGNAVELIVSIIALKERQVLIVQTSLIGSILSNLLLVMGMCFFFGGITRVQQFFNVTVAQTASSLLTLSAASLIIPTAFARWSNGGADATVQLSRGTSIILLVVYGCYLLFQLKSHASLYSEKSAKAEKRNEPKNITKEIASMGAGVATAVGGEKTRDLKLGGGEDDEVEEEPELAMVTALITLAGSTVLVALCAEYMVNSIDALTDTGHISKTFVGLILVPIVGNAAEHATAVTVACKDKMDLAIGVAVGSSMQIALLVLPLVVTLGWILNISEMTLNFDGFQIAVLFVAVLIVNSLISDGKSHWLEGVLLQATYLIIAVAAWFYPTTRGM